MGFAVRQVVRTNRYALVPPMGPDRNWWEIIDTQMNPWQVKKIYPVHWPNAEKLARMYCRWLNEYEL